MDRFAQIFREEAEELLAVLEGSLLESVAGCAEEDGSRVDAIFRALHTIKGSSAMFGFDAISSFSHELESAFDRVRGGEMRLSVELANLALEGCDLIRAMLADSGSDHTAPCDELLERLRDLTGAAPTAAAQNRSADAGAAGDARYRIRFTPLATTFTAGANPLSLLEELRQAGDCSIAADMTAVPPLEDLDPTRCHLAWEVVTRGIRRESISDIFIFHEEGTEVLVQELDASGADEPEQRRRAADGPRSGGIDSIRVPAAKLDHLVNLVGELVTVQARLSQTVLSREDSELLSLTEELERLTNSLRESALGVRMLPIGTTFGRFRRLVHDLAGQLGKEVELVTGGGETEVDKTVLERMADPLVHLIRNCLDHGIETPERRQEAGKPRCGTIELRAVTAADSVLITISDDGGGIDTAAVLARGVERGLVAAGAELPEREILGLIFAPGFSTLDRVTELSGRGVGMDVVKRTVEGLRGTVTVASDEGMGTCFTIRIPLTVAIIESLLVSVAGDSFVLPLAEVEECVELTSEDVARSHGRNLISLRGEIVPYIPLRQRFGFHGRRPEREQVVVVSLEGRKVGLAVDRVVGEHQSVIKNMGRLARASAGVSGATILGDGTVALVLDAGQLLASEEDAAPRH